MKKREFEFWVEPGDIEKLISDLSEPSMLCIYVRKDAVSINGQMVKMILEIPEKKIEITESELWDALNDSGFTWNTISEEILAQKLFNKGADGEN